MTPPLVRFESASRLLATAHDVVTERSVSATAPSWCVERGWVDFLRGLSDEAVHAAERDGLGAHLASLPDAPSELLDLARQIEHATALPIAATVSPDEVARRRASPRKRAQVAAFASLLDGLCPTASRVVDIGSGHGHLTRHLSDSLGLAAVGWERDPARVAVAAALATHDRARFVATDARDAAETLTAQDLVVGLHACGELGDHAVQAALAAGASVAVVGCCLQKRTKARAPLCPVAGLSPDALTYSPSALGLGNARDGDDGVESDLATRSNSRLNRIALRNIFFITDHEMPPGEEMRGVNRRRACGSLEDLVALAFASRGFAPPSAALIAEGARHAREDYWHRRRWELPRTMLARLVEVWIALDRAALLARGGYRTEVVVAFDAQISPRNVAVLGARG